MGYVLFLTVTPILIAMATLLPSTIRARRRRRAIRQVNAERALQYHGEVVRKSQLPADEDSPFDLAGPLLQLIVRRDDGTKIAVAMPIAFDRRFAVGDRVVKQAGRRWPVPADTPANPDEDHSI